MRAADTIFSTPVFSTPVFSTPVFSTPRVYPNELLSALLAGVGDHIAGHLTLVDLPAGAVLRQTEYAEDYAYFPNDALISLLSVIENGKSAEIGVVGSEGMVGVEGLIGGSNPYIQAKALCAGTAFRVPTRVLRDEFNCHGEARWLILRYMQSIITQVAQAVICNRHHSIEQRLCRKLLMSSDRLRGNELALTQSTIAELLGVRREGVTAAAGELRELGVIEYHRGLIRILDRARLEERSCECYAVLEHSAVVWPSVAKERRHRALVRPATLAAGRHDTAGFIADRAAARATAGNGRER
jgi:CRP-like cAMP-binding protein